MFSQKKKQLKLNDLMKETVKYQEVYEFTEEIRPERERGLKWIPT